MSIAAPRLKGRRTLGIVAFVASCAAAVVGTVIQFVAGFVLGGIAQYVDVASLVEVGKQIDPATLPDAAKQIVSTANAISVIAFLAWLGLALWAIIQGIAAIVKRRGRAWGVTALVVVAVGYFVVQIAYTVGLTAGVAPYV